MKPSVRKQAVENAVRYPVVPRRKRPRREDASRRAFLEQEAPGPLNPKLCQAMFAVARADRDPAGTSSERPAYDEWSGFPWLTVVIGSGCLDLPPQASHAPDMLPALVAEAAPKVFAGVRSQLTGLPGYAAEFTAGLVRSRLGDDACPATRTDLEAGDGVGKLEATHVAMLLVAALLTRLYNIARFLGNVPTSRWGEDEARFPDLDAHRLPWNDPRHANPDDYNPLMDPVELVAAIRALIEIAESDDQFRLPPVLALLKRIKERLSSDAWPERRVRLTDVQLITEVAWYYLVTDSLMYPGWTELLGGMMLHSDRAAPGEAARARPRRLTIAQVPSAVRELLAPVTRRSFESLFDSTLSARERLYAGVADVLWAQAEARRQSDAVARDVPLASAFVASLDIELDMAMWVGAAGRPFQVAVPVHVREDPESEDAAFCWLIGRVEPMHTGSTDEQLQALRGNVIWSLMKHDALDGEAGLLPTIVHLAGCPLFDLPDLEREPDGPLARDLIAVGITHGGASPIIRHAVTLDEHLALRQSSAELYWVVSEDKDREGRRSLALAPGLSGAGSKSQRYWLALGVAIDDAAIRNRLASQLILSWVREHGSHDRAVEEVAVPASIGLLGPAPSDTASVTSADELSEPGADAAQSPRADVYGVAVNRRLSPEEIGLFNWLGLHVIHDDCQAFTGDLYHYAAHVRQARKRPPIDETCELGGGGQR